MYIVNLLATCDVAAVEVSTFLPIYCRMLAVTINLVVPEQTNVVCVMVMEHLAHKLKIRIHIKI